MRPRYPWVRCNPTKTSGVWLSVAGRRAHPPRLLMPCNKSLLFRPLRCSVHHLVLRSSSVPDILVQSRSNRSAAKSSGASILWSHSQSGTCRKTPTMTDLFLLTTSSMLLVPIIRHYAPWRSAPKVAHGRRPRNSSGTSGALPCCALNVCGTWRCSALRRSYLAPWRLLLCCPRRSPSAPWSTDCSSAVGNSLPCARWSC